MDLTLLINDLTWFWSDQLLYRINHWKMALDMDVVIWPAAVLNLFLLYVWFLQNIVCVIVELGHSIKIQRDAVSETHNHHYHHHVWPAFRACPCVATIQTDSPLEVQFNISAAVIISFYTELKYDFPSSIKAVIKNKTNNSIWKLLTHHIWRLRFRAASAKNRGQKVMN